MTATLYLLSDIFASGVTVDPTVGPGIAAPIGAILPRKGTPQLWQKQGALDTDWALVSLSDGDKGDITVSLNGSVWTIDTGVVTNAKLANMANSTIKARITAGAGAPEDATATQVTALLNPFTALLQGLAPPSGGGTANFLRADGSWAAPTGATVADGNYGDVTVSGAGTVWTVNNGVITFAKMQNIATDSLIGRDTAGAGVPENITLNATLEMTGAQVIQRAALTGDVTAAAGSNATTIANSAVTNAKMADMTQATVKGRAAGAGTGAPQDLTQAQVTALINAFTSVLSGAVPASGGGTTNFLRADATFAAVATTALSGSSGWYGTGIDGAVTIGAGTTTITRGMSYSTLTVQNAGILITDLWCIMASTSVTVDAGGVIHQDGNNATTNVGGQAGGTAGHTYGRGGNGTAGQVNAGAAGGNASQQPKELPTTGATSGQGGVGGSGNAGANAGGAGGTQVVTTATSSGTNLALPDIIRGCYGQNQAAFMSGGAGGGSGGGNGAAAGNAAGGGGGVVVVCAPIITNNGAIRALGGNGIAAVNNNTGGGSGGGGGKVFLICRSFTGTAPDVSGGTGAAGLGNGTAGTNGQTGYTFTFVGV